MDKIIETIAGEFNIKTIQVENTVKLIQKRSYRKFKR